MANETQTSTKPLPEPDDASRPFFEGALAGRLMLMRCNACATWRLPARSHCDNCLSTDTSWEQASGAGTVRSFGIMHQRYHAAFADDLPYNLAIVELAEGPRMVTNVVGVANAAIRVGMAVLVAFEQHDDVAIPKFRAA